MNRVSLFDRIAVPAVVVIAVAGTAALQVSMPPQSEAVAEEVATATTDCPSVIEAAKIR